VHPLTGEGIAYGLWSAELLAEGMHQGDPQSYEELWRRAYGASFAPASAGLSSAQAHASGYELTFQLFIGMALRIPNRVS
jgi:hypothetical protein